ncbi:MAG: glycosyltransferase family 9 protein [Nitrospinae bacterium]|nr:glycosyltransferase family 9 protein [Nitrospinota bacterium]
MVDRILVMSLTRMGDLVQATPLISGLRHKYPRAKITLMVSSDFAKFAPNIPDIDDSIVLDMRQFTKKSRWKELTWVVIYRYLESFLDDMKHLRFDLVVNLRHSKLSALMILYLGIKKVCGFMCNETGDRMTRHPWMQFFGIEPFNRVYNPFNLVEIFTRSADVKLEDQKIRINVAEETQASIAEQIDQENVGDEELLIGIQAGSSLENRRWPTRYFAELADLLVNRLNARIVLFGVAGEASVAEEIRNLADHRENIIDLTGKTDITQLIGWVGKCSYLVTNDTGTMHIAAALGTRIVGLFFAHAHPYETGPYSPGHVLFQARISCAPCSYGVQCNNIVCIHKVQPRHVYSMILNHRKEHIWKLPNDMGPLDEMHIFETRYGDDRRLILKPLIRHVVNLDDIFRCCYSRLWLDSLRESVGEGDSPDQDAMVETIRQDYDCEDMAGIIGSLKEKIEILGDLIRLGRKGLQVTGSIIRLFRGKPSPEKLQALGEEIDRIDERLNLTGCAHPELKPVVDMFKKRKENFQGENVVKLAGATLRCYEQMGEELARLSRLLNAVVESFASPGSQEDQVGAKSINAFVPGR